MPEVVRRQLWCLVLSTGALIAWLVFLLLVAFGVIS